MILNSPMVYDGVSLISLKKKSACQRLSSAKKPQRTCAILYFFIHVAAEDVVQEAQKDLPEARRFQTHLEWQKTLQLQKKSAAGSSGFHRVSPPKRGSIAKHDGIMGI